MAPPALDGCDIYAPILNTGMHGTKRIDLRLTRRQARALQLLFDGLTSEREEVQLHTLRPIKHHGEALRWLLDRIASEYDVTERGMFPREEERLEDARLLREKQRVEMARAKQKAAGR